MNLNEIKQMQTKFLNLSLGLISRGLQMSNGHLLQQTDLYVASWASFVPHPHRVSIKLTTEVNTIAKSRDD